MAYLSDLSVAQRRMLIRLDDGLEHQDSVGLELGDLSIDQLRVCSELMGLGLVEARSGWGGSFWFRLTEAGRRVRETGAA